MMSSSNRFLRSRLKTRHLLLLVELGRHRSILHAAEAIGLTQPGASKLLSELEDTLGVSLFDRLPRGVAPTWHGEVMIRRAAAALAEMEAAHEEVMLGASAVGGRASLGTVMTPSTGLVPAAVQLLKSRHPQLRLSVAVDTSKVLIEHLCGGELDIVIGRILDLSLAPELDFEPLAEESHRLVVRAGHPWLGRAELSIDELAAASWILPPPGMLRDRLSAMFINHGVQEPADCIETMALSMIPLLLMAGDRIVALPEALVQPYIEFGILAVLPVDVDLRLDCYGIVTRRKHHLAPAAAALLQALRETAGRFAPQPGLRT